jgi:hypothetical protein
LLQPRHGRLPPAGGRDSRPLVSRSGQRLTPSCLVTCLCRPTDRLWLRRSRPASRAAHPQDTETPAQRSGAKPSRRAIRSSHGSSLARNATGGSRAIRCASEIPGGPLGCSEVRVRSSSRYPARIDRCLVRNTAGRRPTPTVRPHRGNVIVRHLRDPALRVQLQASND